MTWVAVGTAAAIGAGVGAGSQIIQGKEGDDILKGALIGGATGALTGGAGAAFGGGAGGAGGSLTTEAASQLAPELVQTAATNVAPEIVSQAATNVIPEVAGQAVTSAAPTGIAQIPQGFTAAEINAINMGQADALAASSPFSPLASGPVTSDVAVTPLVQAPPQVSPQLIDVPPGTPFEPSSMAPSNLVSEPPMNQFQGSMTRPELAQMTKAEVGSNPFVEGFNDVTNYIEKNPFKSAAIGYLGLNAMGAFRNAQQPMTFGGPSTSQTYSLSPNFQPGPYTRPNVYQERRYNYASGGIAQLQSGGPVERMSAMNTAMNPQGGLYPQGMIDKTQYATPIQRPVSSEMVMEDSAYERSNPMLMASGGITALRSGGRPDASESLNRYLGMMEGAKPAPAARPDVGIFEDKDPDTMYQDALTAALIRQGKINKRASMGAPTMVRPMQMGAINLNPPGMAGGGSVPMRGGPLKAPEGYRLDDKTGMFHEIQRPGIAGLLGKLGASGAAGLIERLTGQRKAEGGIAGYSLGGYADGGNPRLLKGPGDGMSDNIPATIANRQPARLADGEFVIPADVVSGLGNGSTNAGAKKLHKMMDKVRVARTGKKKQAPAIKAEKYLA